ncbi:MAG TPA: 3-hydroxyacyl-CoA dehydrogenase NAD-binding domain-containing protein, partial [Archangium sp.]|nr:3-hydroxyacyl-CoA dehydrogenase NAD-binding domain-containing protein [Archangium sp.]
MASEHIIVVGAGQMGSGIAQVALQAGLRVTLVDVSKEGLAKGAERIKAGLKKLVEKGKLDAARLEAANTNLATATSATEVKDVDFAIEAVTENEDLKRRIFVELDGVVKAGGILATNTSSIPITRIAAATKRPENVIGMHFMNPVPVMQLVEIIRGLATSDETTRKVVELSRALGKTPVEVNDYP